MLNCDPFGIYQKIYRDRQSAIAEIFYCRLMAKKKVAMAELYLPFVSIFLQIDRILLRITFLKLCFVGTQI